MKEFKHETIIVTKEAWKFLENNYRESGGFPHASEKWLEKLWKGAFRNLGANPKTHPIKKNEMRIEHGSFLMSIDKIKKLLTEKGFEYRQDGFVAEGINV